MLRITHQSLVASASSPLSYPKYDIRLLLINFAITVFTPNEQQILLTNIITKNATINYIPSDFCAQ